VPNRKKCGYYIFKFYCFGGMGVLSKVTSRFQDKTVFALVPHLQISRKILVSLSGNTYCLNIIPDIVNPVCTTKDLFIQSKFLSHVIFENPPFVSRGDFCILANRKKH